MTHAPARKSLTTSGWRARRSRRRGSSNCARQSFVATSTTSTHPPAAGPGKGLAGRGTSKRTFTKRTPTRQTLTVGLTALLLLPGLAHAAAPAPEKLVLDRYAEVKELVANTKDHDALASLVDRILGADVAWEAFSQRTLATSIWSTLSEAQRTTFIAAYRELLVDRYARRIKPRTEFTLTLRGKPEVAPDGQSATVRTTVISLRHGKRLGVDVDFSLVLLKSDAGHPVWRIDDIVTDTVSRAYTYRPKFRSIYARSGLDGLVKTIRQNARKHRAAANRESARQ